MIEASSAHFADQRLQDVVCVFAGATSGIGFQTLYQMMTMVHSGTFYVFGRSAAAFEAQKAALEQLNPHSRVVFIETNVALLSGIDKACAIITAAESRVDFLCMSMGGIPKNGAECMYSVSAAKIVANVIADTQERLEVTFTISYYSRMRLVFNLLPLIKRSPHARVLSVLNGGKEKTIDEQDLGLENTWSMGKVMRHTTTMTSLSFDYLAANSASGQVTFIHNFPSLVKSDNVRKQNFQKAAPFWRRLLIMAMKQLFAILRFFIGQSPKESGQRQAYHLTSEHYPRGSWRVNEHGEIVPDNTALTQYKTDGLAERVWQFTSATWDRALGPY